MDARTTGNIGHVQGLGREGRLSAAQILEEARLLFQGSQEAQRQVEVETKRLRLARKKVKRCEKAQQIIQLVAENIQNQAHTRIAGLVTRCLEAIFEDPYEFKIRFERKRGKTDAVLTFVRDGSELDDPTDECGGGVVDVAAFALRLACLILQKPLRRKLLVLDEPFKFVSEEYRDKLRDLILVLSHELNVQFVVVTHIPELQIGKVIQL